MILIGQYDSPYVRRVAISLRLLGFEYEHDTRSVFADFSSLRRANPVGRVPALVLDDGTVLIDSSAILDWLDQEVGPRRALVPPEGEPRRDALRRIALATGAMDKIVALFYEERLRPSSLRWPEWIERCRTQVEGAIAALAALDWPGQPLGQAHITTACLYRFIQMAKAELVALGRFPALDALSERCEARAEFQATFPADVRTSAST